MVLGITKQKNGNDYGNGIEIGLETRSVQNLGWERLSVSLTRSAVSD